MKIKDTGLGFVVEPLLQPFGFKGGYLSELWQVVSKVETQDNYGVGVGIQSVLWSDEAIFKSSSQSGGNAYMFLLTQYALKLLKNTEFATPTEAMLGITDKVYEYAKVITNNSKLRKTFALNALVSVDNALWQLYAREQESEDIITLVDDETKKNLSGRQDKIYSIPLISYKTSADEIRKIAEDGYFLMKIKIGSDPDGDNSREKMVEWDKKRLEEIHNIVKDMKTPYTDDGHYVYYLDANSRYDTKERLMNFLEHAQKIGAYDRIVILEEPFAEETEFDVSDIGLNITADESAHSVESAIKRMDEGYKAMAIKPIAKTVSESLLIINEAAKRAVPCFCADLTVNPLMVDINKNIAARINAFPKINIGIFESNGAQNYKNWDLMKTYHPMYNKAAFTECKNGIYTLNDDFYKVSGGIYKNSEYYNKIAR
ncbi:MAG: L-alanine-DL-glutamate epimerase [Ruminococcaceae bacterium]|nr:L-alanine-DL-glutamate epimerase [Oscillospiraceae bacterium]